MAVSHLVHPRAYGAQETLFRIILIAEGAEVRSAGQAFVVSQIVVGLAGRAIRGVQTQHHFLAKLISHSSASEDALVSDRVED